MKPAIRVVVVKTAAQFAQAAAQALEDVLGHAEKPTMLMPTGNTPRGLYQELVRTRNLSSINWHQAHVCALDEYVGIEKSDSRSFHHQLWEELCAPLGLNPQQLITPQGTAASAESEAQRYEQAIAAHRPLHLAVLGVGTNGHVAFNEPGVDFTLGTHVTPLTPETRHDNAELFKPEAPPTHAITVGIATLMQAEAIIVLASGGKKSAAIQALLDGTPNPEWPVSALVDHPHVSLIIDQDCYDSLRNPPERATQNWKV